MFIHVGSHCFQCAMHQILIFSLCKTAYFQMSVAQNPTGKKFSEKKEVSHGSTTFTCRVTVTTVEKKVILPTIMR